MDGQTVNKVKGVEDTESFSCKGAHLFSHISGQIKRLLEVEYKLAKIAGLSDEQALAICTVRYEKFAR